MVPRTVLTRPFKKITAANNSNFTKKVNTVKGTRVNTATPKAVLSAVKGNKGNVVKASACWVWRPKHKILEEPSPSKNNVALMSFNEKLTYNDAQADPRSRSGPNWLFDIDALTNSMNYKPVVAENRFNGNVGTKACADAGKARVKIVPGKNYILLPLWTQDLPFSSSLKDSSDSRFKPSGEEEKKDAEELGNEGGNPSEVGERFNQEKDASVNSTNNNNIVSPTVNAARIEDNAVDENIFYGCADDPNIPYLEEISRFKPKKVVQALKDPSWIEVMQEELLQFKLQEVWTLVELPNGKRAIGTKWAILTYASLKLCGYQMDVKSAFLYEKIEDEVYVCQLPGFEDPDFLAIECKKQTEVANSTTKAGICLDYENGHVGITYYAAKGREKKIVVTEACVKRDLQLEDANGVDCLPNAIIFEQLTLMGLRTTGEGSDMPTITQPLSSQPQKKHKPRKPKKKDTQLPQSSVLSDNVAEEVVNEENVPTHSNDRLLSGQDMAKKEVSTADPVTTAGEVVTTANVEVSTASPTAITIIYI
ncbi:ribonuclease H-like domain-containing protein [Tanacetum coccineum]